MFAASPAAGEAVPAGAAAKLMAAAGCYVLQSERVAQAALQLAFAIGSCWACSQPAWQVGEWVAPVLVAAGSPSAAVFLFYCRVALIAQRLWSLAGAPTGSERAMLKAAALLCALALCAGQAGDWKQRSSIRAWSLSTCKRWAWRLGEGGPRAAYWCLAAAFSA